MPELPEVETIARQLNQNLRGRRIEEIEVLREKSFQGDKKKVLGKKIKGVRRRAKMLIIELERSEYCLVVHLKMTGQLIYELKVKSEKLKVGNRESEKDKYTRVVIKLDRGVVLFNDLRVFGWVKIVQNSKFHAKGRAGKVQSERDFGPDVTDRKFTVDYLGKVLGESGRAVKLVLLDQKKMAGLGNIYACEILHCAGVNPKSQASNLKQIQITKLHKCIKEIMRKAIKYGGTTAGDDRYVNARGQPGRYQRVSLVYDREGESCRRCGTKIKKIKLAGRGTYYCPVCQG